MSNQNNEPELTIYDVFRTPPAQQAWLRSFPMLASFGVRTHVEGATLDDRTIPQLDCDFWQTQTEAVEAIALTHMSNLNIDGIFNEVAFIIDEDLSRFNPMVRYLADYFADGDPVRLEIERDIAECVKRDLAWMTVEELIGVSGFFSGLRAWYNRGRWPHGWVGDFPHGSVLIT